MVNIGFMMILCLGFMGPQDASRSDPAREALKTRHFPWYDEKTDSAKPIWGKEEEPPPPKETNSSSSSDSSFYIQGIGQFLTTVILIFLVVALMVGLAWAYQHYSPDPILKERKQVAGKASRTAALPAGLPENMSDPWAEAIRLRSSGDLSGAIVALFVHELRTLDRNGLIRLSPGKTARQLVRSVNLQDARRAVMPTLQLFEEAYYGHRPPSPEAFDQAWQDAESLLMGAQRGVMT